uniref:oligosaccharide flippase family protein n=1 Tax=Gracilibacillus dipsosauri TaxID=178340 RepID=UPI0024091F49
AFPLCASVQDDDKRLKEGYKKVIQQLLFWLCPTFVLAGVLAEPLFRFVFTEKWVPAVPYFRWLCVIGIFYPINLYNLNILNVKGRSDLYLKLGVIKKALITIGVIISLPFGIYALLAFQALYALFGYFVNSYYSGRFIQYSMIAQLKDVMPIVILGLFVGATVLVVDNYLAIFDDWVRLLIGLGFGGALYLSIAHHRDYHPYRDFLMIIRTKLSGSHFRLKL